MGKKKGLVVNIGDIKLDFSVSDFQWTMRDVQVFFREPTANTPHQKLCFPSELSQLLGSITPLALPTETTPNDPSALSPWLSKPSQLLFAVSDGESRPC